MKVRLYEKNKKEIIKQGNLITTDKDQFIILICSNGKYNALNVKTCSLVSDTGCSKDELEHELNRSDRVNNIKRVDRVSLSVDINVKEYEFIENGTVFLTNNMHVYIIASYSNKHFLISLASYLIITEIRSFDNFLDYNHLIGGMITKIVNHNDLELIEKRTYVGGLINGEEVVI